MDLEPEPPPNSPHVISARRVHMFKDTSNGGRITIGRPPRGASTERLLIELAPDACREVS